MIIFAQNHNIQFFAFYFLLQGRREARVFRNKSRFAFGLLFLQILIKRNLPKKSAARRYTGFTALFPLVSAMKFLVFRFFKK